MLLDHGPNDIRVKPYSIFTEQEYKKLKKKFSIFAVKRIKEKREFINKMF